MSDSVFVQIGNESVSYAESAIEKIKAAVKENEKFIIEKPVVTNKINVADFGLSEDAPAAENAEALQNAIDYCKENHISALELNPGTYKIVKENARQLHFDHISNFAILGNGAKLVFCETENVYAGGKFLNFTNCSNILVQDLVIDWDWDTFPLFILGKVTKILGNTVTVTSDKFKIPDFYSVYNTRGWDAEKDCVTADVEGLPPSPIKVKKISEKEIEFTYEKLSGDVAIGQALQICFKPKMNANAIVIENGMHTTLENVEINAAPYIAVYASGGEYLEINHCKIIPGEGRRFASYGGNEIHCTKGHFKFTNNVTSGICDDNLHFSNGYLGGGIKKLDDYTIEAENLQHYATHPLIYEGAVMELRSNEYEPKYWEGIIKEYQWNFNKNPNTATPHTCTITFENKLPAHFMKTDYMFNVEFQNGQYIIENNQMYGGLCHGMYIGMSNGVIRNNTIETFSYPGLILNCVKRWNKWFIGNPINNVMISGNVLKNVNLNKRDPASLFVGAGYDNAPTDYYPCDYYAVQNVVVENNIIENSGLIAMGTWSSRNVLFQNNKIINPNLYQNKDRFKDYKRIYATDCDNIHFENNTVEITRPVFGTDGIYVNNATDVYENGESFK